MSSSSANTRLSKTQLSKMVQFGRFLLPDILVNSVTNSLVNSFGEELKKMNKKENEKNEQKGWSRVSYKCSI